MVGRRAEGMSSEVDISDGIPAPTGSLKLRVRPPRLGGFCTLQLASLELCMYSFSYIDTQG